MNKAPVQQGRGSRVQSSFKWTTSQWKYHHHYHDASSSCKVLSHFRIPSIHSKDFLNNVSILSMLYLLHQIDQRERDSRKYGSISLSKHWQYLRNKTFLPSFHFLLFLSATINELNPVHEQITPLVYSVQSVSLLSFNGINCTGQCVFKGQKKWTWIGKRGEELELICFP